MFDGVRYNWRLSRLRRRRRSCNKNFQRLYEKAKKTKSTDPNVIVAAWDNETEQYDDDISELVTKRLMELAAYYLVPVPERRQLSPDDFGDEGDAWVRSHYSRRWQLSMTGAAELRAAIRKERRESSELVLRWLSAATGLIGAAIGLVALLIKHR